MLYQLSYSRSATPPATPSLPVATLAVAQSHRSELNRRPLDYESSALPLSYGGVAPRRRRQWS